MEGSDPPIDRRTVLSTTAAGIGALLVPSAASARPGRGRRGPPEHAGRPDHAGPLTLEGGKAVPARGNAPVAPAQARALAATQQGASHGSPAKVSKQELAEGLNAAAERGDVEIVGEGEKGVMVRPTPNGGE